VVNEGKGGVEEGKLFHLECSRSRAVDHYVKCREAHRTLLQDMRCICHCGMHFSKMFWARTFELHDTNSNDNTEPQQQDEEAVAATCHLPLATCRLPPPLPLSLSHSLSVVAFVRQLKLIFALKMQFSRHFPSFAFANLPPSC